MHLLVFANFYDSIILARNEIIAFSKFYFLLLAIFWKKLEYDK